MNQKDNHTYFKKHLNSTEYDTPILDNSVQREESINELMTKLNITADEAELLLVTLESKSFDIISEGNNYQNNVSQKNSLKVEHDKPEAISLKSKKISSDSDNPFEERGSYNSSNVDFNSEIKISEKPHFTEDEGREIIYHEDYGNNQELSSKNESVINVDSILTEIIPDYNQQVSIELNHAYLTFEVQNEKVDTIKEGVIRKLKRNTPKNIKIEALKDISFKIYKGEKVGIIGYNGAGKSTLLNVIAGIYPLDKGTVRTYGNISPLLSLGAGFDPNYSGRKNIRLNGAVLGYDKEFLESKLDEIIEFSELGKYIDIPIKNYSSGMLAKLGFSIAAIVEPDILIIDEILGVGDASFRKKSKDKIKALMDSGTTVLFVSHSIPDVREICDKAIWIDEGSVKEIGEVNNVCDHYLKDAERASNEQIANIQFDY